MRIDLRTSKSSQPVRVEVDPAHPPSSIPTPSPDHPATTLDWRQAIDQHGHLQRCPACGCRELFARRDFPQKTGLAIVIVGALTAVTMFSMGYVLWSFAALALVALIDATIVPFTKRCLVCYRCRSEFRKLPIPKDQPQWDLATGEKYRQSATPTPH